MRNNRICRRTIGPAILALSLLIGGVHAVEPLRVIILSGKNVHDWKTTTPELQRIYEESGRFKVLAIVNDPATCTPATFAQCDAIVCNWTAHPEMHGHPWGEVAERAVADFVHGGKGFVAFHAASTAYYDWPEFQQLVGLTWKWQFTSHTAYATFKVALEDRDHPITRGLTDFWITDELYQNMVSLGKPEYQLLCKAFARADISGSGKFEPMLITAQLGQGRGVNLLLGHDVPAMRNVGFRTLILRGTEWAATGQVTLPIPVNWPATAAAAAVTELDPDSVLKAVASYQFGQPRLAFSQLEQLAMNAHSATDEASVAQRKQLAEKSATLLATPIAPEAKVFLCKQLALIATAEQVPAIAPLLLDEPTSDAARSVLEGIPGSAAGQALRTALLQAKGPIRLGIINSLGNRAEVASVEPLSTLLHEADETTVAAAAAGLGKIGGDQAAQALEAMLDKTSGRIHQAVADALLGCAGKLAPSQLHGAKESAPTRMATLRNAVLAEPEKANDRVGQALADKDLDQRTMALRLIREFPQQVKTLPLAEQVAKLPAEPAVLLLIALADRGDPAALPAALQAAEHEDTTVRVPALQTIGRLGDAANVPFLAERALRKVEAEKAAAINSLAVLRGQGVNAAIVKLLDQASAETKIVLIRSLAARDAKESIEAPIRAVADGDNLVRIEAWQTLEELAQEKDLPILVELLVRAGTAERTTAERAVTAVVKQVDPNHPRAAVIMAKWDTAKESAAKCSLAGVLAGIGDDAALAALRLALKEPDPSLRATVILGLGAWTTPAPLADLRQLARNEPDEDRRLIALRSFIRLAAQAKDQPMEEMIALIEDLLKRTNPPDDQKALLGLLAQQHAPAAMQLGLTYLKYPALADAAAEAVVQIAGALANTHNDEVKAALKQVHAATASPQILDKAAGVMRKADKPRNLAIGAIASSPDGLEPDGASGNDQAAIDGDPKTYWDEADNQPLYRFKVAFPQLTAVNAINLIGHAYQSHSPKDFDIRCDDAVVKTVRNADYDKVSNEIFVTFPKTACKSIELKITGYYGGSPGIRELEIYDLPSGAPGTAAEPTVPPNASFAWRQSESALALLNGDKVLWQLNCPKGAGKPTFYPLALSDGTELTWLSPPDHIWHRSLWFSWTGINGINYWEEDLKTGLSAGLTEVIEAKLVPRSDFSARAEITLSYHVPAQPAVLTEKRVLEISAPDAEGRYPIDWQSDFTAGTEDVRLTGGSAGGGYAGLSVRIAKSTRGWRVLDSEGRQDTATPNLAKNTHGKRSRWQDFSFADAATGQIAGITIFDHPNNLRHPSYWHVLVDEERSFGYFSPAPLWLEPYRLPAGQKLLLKYRILVHPARWDKPQLDQEWQTFSTK